MNVLVWLLALFASVSAAGAQTTPPRKTILPVAPADLLKLLPIAPHDWQIKESKANSFYNEALVSQANRQFVGPPLPPPIPNGTPPPPPMTRLRLTDTAYVPALYADFEGFKPGRYGNTESLYVDNLPARRVTLSNGDRLRVLFKGRFVLEVETHNQAANADVTWIRGFDLRKISATPDSTVVKLPNPLTVVSIDELNPKANSSYQVNWSTQDDLDAARNRKP